MPFSRARQGDRVVMPDMHLVQPPGPALPVLVAHPFAGVIDGAGMRSARMAVAGTVTIGG